MSYWEYKSDWLTETPTGFHMALMERLKVLGRDGWELAAIVEEPECVEKSVTLILKRQNSGRI